MRVSPARIACLDFNLQKTKMQLGVQVLVTDPRELEKIRQRWSNLVKLSQTWSNLLSYLCQYTYWLFILFYRESDVTKERIEKLLKAGANVILTTKGIDDMALKVLFLTFLPFFHTQICNFWLLLLFFGWNQYFVEAGAIAVRRVRKEDLRHVAKATGATSVIFVYYFMVINKIWS